MLSPKVTNRVTVSFGTTGAVTVIVNEQALARWTELNKMRPDAEHRARAQLIQTLLNHNDFVTIR